MREIEIEVRGMTFTGLADGPDDGPLVMLLHGLPRNSWEWHHQIPGIAARGYRVVAYDLRGFCDGARPEGVEAYHLDEYNADTLAIVDEIAGAGTRFHLMGTSIGANMAWALAAKHPDRVASLVCINIPHPGALATASANVTSKSDDQREKFSYIKAAQKEGNERVMFEAMLERQGVSEEESAPYRTALDSDEALRAVYNFYRAIPLWAGDRVEPVSMPTTFIWPTGSGNVSSAAVDALPDWVTGPYQLHVVENVHQPALQAAPERLTVLLIDHLADHGTGPTM